MSLFAQNQNSFELDITSDGFLLFLHFIQANVKPVLDKKIHYTAGVPEATIISKTGKNSPELTNYITEQYTQFNHRLNFAMAKSSMKHIFRLCGYPEIPSTKTIEELSAVFTEFYSKTRANLEVSNLFSLIDLQKMQTFLTACQAIFTDKKQPANYDSKIMMCEALRAFLTRYQASLTMTLESRPSTTACSSALFSHGNTSGSRDPIHVNATPLMTIKHEMICTFEMHITRLEKKVSSGWHTHETRKLASKKASLLANLKSDIYLADTQKKCKAILEEALNNSLIKEDKTSTTTKAVINFYETFFYEVSSSSHAPAIEI